MKKLMMIAALMVATLTASAQGPFIKPMAGGTLTTFTGTDVDDLKMRFGFVGGVELGDQFGKHFALTGGALYTMQGARVSNDYTKYNINFDYINVPIMAAFYPVEGFGIKAGAQFGFLTRAKWGDNDFKDYVKKTDFSIPVGLSYEFEETSIDLRYNIGLSNILKERVEGDRSRFYGANIDGEIKNCVLMLTIGYKIALY